MQRQWVSFDLLYYHSLARGLHIECSDDDRVIERKVKKRVEKKVEGEIQK